jgi:hypothetical protein
MAGASKPSSWLDLLAQSGEGAAMDALEDAAFAPLDFVIFSRGRIFEGSAHEEALHLHGQESLEDCVGVEGQATGEGVCRRGDEDL